MVSKRAGSTTCVLTTKLLHACPYHNYSLTCIQRPSLQTLNEFLLHNNNVDHTLVIESDVPPGVWPDGYDIRTQHRHLLVNTTFPQGKEFRGLPPDLGSKVMYSIRIKTDNVNCQQMRRWRGCPLSVLNFEWVSCCQLRTEGPAAPQGKSLVTDMADGVYDPQEMERN